MGGREGNVRGREVKGMGCEVGGWGGGGELRG